VTRFRDLGLSVGQLPPGSLNAITDVGGVAVGAVTLIEGEGELRVGEGPVRTGVTVVVPHPGIADNPVFAGCHSLNGNGEMTGLEWVRHSGCLTTPVGITNTHSVGVVRDALVQYGVRSRGGPDFWSLPVVAETYDGALNDINGFHVRAEHLFAAMEAATDGPVPEGNVGGGTGMICHDFKGGTGTASRVVGRWTVGALVQSNYGERRRLTVAGVPVGEEIPTSAVPSAWDQAERIGTTDTGSIIVIVATDAPLLPHQLQRLAERAGLGIARAGGAGGNSSGDIFLAFSTAAADRIPSDDVTESPTEPIGVEMLPNAAITPLFWGAIEATEEAILNALVAAETMVGRDGITAHALPHDRLVDVMTKYGRGPAS
jgi:D-aminopeptidase